LQESLANRIIGATEAYTKEIKSNKIGILTGHHQYSQEAFPPQPILVIISILVIFVVAIVAMIEPLKSETEAPRTKFSVIILLQ
jgi:hypothetical protein